MQSYLRLDSHYDLAYRLLVEQQEKARDISFFDNEGPEHASIVLERLVANSNDVLRVYSFNCDGEITDNEAADCLTEVQKFVESRNGRVKLIVDELADKTSRVFSYLNEVREKGGSVDIRKSTKELREACYFNKAGEPGKDGAHFQLGDEQLLRYEWKRSSHKAVWSFNHKERSSQLSNFFDTHFETCPSII